MRWWLRSLAIGAAVGLAAGFVIGGLLGRIYMRVLFLVEEDTRGVETAFGAIVGELTADGTVFIFVFGGYIGAGFGLAYVALRPLMPSAFYVRELLFVVGATAAMLPLIIRQNLEDFSFLPVTLSLVLIGASVALAAIPVPLLTERFAPDRPRPARPLSYVVLGLGLTALIVAATLSVLDAYAVEPLL